MTLFIRILTLTLMLSLLSTASARIYTQDEPVDVWATRIGPYRYPMETYDFYEKIPMCVPKEVFHKPLRLGEALHGERYVKLSMFRLKFMEDEKDVLACEMNLDAGLTALLREYIQQQYTYEILVDGLPTRAFLGKLGGASSPANDTVRVLEDPESAEGEPALNTHTAFQITVNKDNRIVDVSVNLANPVALPRESDVVYTVMNTYSVSWVVKDVKYETRHHKYYASFETEDLDLQWNSILHASLAVLVVSGFFAALLIRMLLNDFREYRDHPHPHHPYHHHNKSSLSVSSSPPLPTSISVVSELDDESGANASSIASTGDHEFGWKLLRHDIFRPPAHPALLSALVGVGAQLLFLVVLTLTLGTFEIFHPLNHGYLVMSMAVIYCVTACIAGFVSGYLYKQLQGRFWVRAAMMTSSIFSVPTFMLYALLNLFSLTVDSVRTIPIWSVFAVIFMWGVITFPLTILGSIAGRNMARPIQSLEASQQQHSHPRPIPRAPWYRSPFVLVIVSGIIPFISVYLELYHILQTLWGYKIFSLYEVLTLVFFMLIIVVAVTSVSASYFQLTIEDYRWWWGSIFYGGSISLYIFGFSLLFFFRGESGGFGAYHFASFLYHTSIMCTSIFLIFGFVGFSCTKIFMRFIFKSIKND